MTTNKDIEPEEDIEAYIVAEDDRYPILVTRSANFLRGYNINRATGKLKPTCVCYAKYKGECCCDYEWK